MTESPDYAQHDAQYRWLREMGCSGWGGKAFPQRMAGWQATVDNLIASELFPPSAAALLELGSGAGDSLIPFARAGYRVTGIEVSPAAVAWAEEKFATLSMAARFHVGDVSRGLPFADAAFDAVLDAACLHCLVGADRPRILAEVYRVLRPDGFFLVSHMVNDPRELSADLTYDAASRLLMKNGTPYRTIPKEARLVTDVEHAGFRIERREVRRNAWWDHAELWCVRL